MNQELASKVGIYNENEQPQTRPTIIAGLTEVDLIQASQTLRHPTDEFTAKLNQFPTQHERPGKRLKRILATAVAGLCFSAVAERSSVHADGELGSEPTPLSPGDIERIPAGLPAGDIAFANVTAVNLGNGGAFLSAYEGHPEAYPGTSTVNTGSNAVRANAALVPLDSEGKFNLRAGGVGSQHAVVDIIGQLKANPYTEIYTQPVRILDTRLNAPEVTGGSETRIMVGQEHAGKVAIVNMTTDASESASWSALYSCLAGYPGTSNLNLNPGETRAILAMVEVDANGEICMKNLSDARGQIGDLLGFLNIDASALSRLVDTRENFGGSRVPGGQERGYVVGKPNSLVAMNVTAVNPSNPGWFACYSSAGGYNGTSNGNVSLGDSASPAFIIAKTDAEGKIYCMTHAGMDADFVIDATELDPADADGQVNFGSYFTTDNPQRVFDSRGTGDPDPGGEGVEITSLSGPSPVQLEQIDISCEYQLYPGSTSGDKHYDFTFTGLAPDLDPNDSSVHGGDSLFAEWMIYRANGSASGAAKTVYADGAGIANIFGVVLDSAEGAQSLSIDGMKITKNRNTAEASVTTFNVDIDCDPIS